MLSSLVFFFCWLVVGQAFFERGNYFNNSHSSFIDHVYYDVFFYDYNQTQWSQLDLKNEPRATVSEFLSSTDDSELPFDLGWDFEFYGHKHSSVYISPNGYISTHPPQCLYGYCNWYSEVNSVPRFIGPLASDFNPSWNASSTVLLYHTPSYLVVQWDQVNFWFWNASYVLQNFTAPTLRYTFQVTIHRTGSIEFHYNSVPKWPEKVEVPSYNGYFNYTAHFGLQDSAMVMNNSRISFTAYRPVIFDREFIMNLSTIVFRPRPTCSDQLTCGNCAVYARHPDTRQTCGWCPSTLQCTDGLGREFHDFQNNCDRTTLWNLSVSDCTAVRMTVRERCSVEDRVVAKSPDEEELTGHCKFHSGHIVGKSWSGDYIIEYDRNGLSNSEVPYFSVHVCPQVSHDYREDDVPPACNAYCPPIPVETVQTPQSNTVWIPILITILSVVCCFTACGIFYKHRGMPGFRERYRPYAPSALESPERTNVELGMQGNESMIDPPVQQHTSYDFSPIQPNPNSNPNPVLYSNEEPEEGETPAEEPVVR